VLHACLSPRGVPDLDKQHVPDKPLFHLPIATQDEFRMISINHTKIRLNASETIQRKFLSTHSRKVAKKKIGIDQLIT